jgi:LuxR family maltose regulon positive regulatory protein
VRRAAGPGAGGVVGRPGLFARLGGSAQVVVVSAPAGSGKTVLLRSWIDDAGLAERVGCVTVGRDERDARQFWLAVVGALRRTVPGAALLQPVTAAPDLDGGAIVERLLTDLAALREPVWLVLDDVHELSSEALPQLELLLMRAPRELRFVLATRHDVRLGLHRLRLAGELAEVRPGDLRFSLAEARELFDAAGVTLPASAVATLYERTEGWAAGLRLAALSLAGHPNPARFAAEFSGTERTVAEYLLAEVLDRQDAKVRRMLLRTSVLQRVNGELADLLTGDGAGERMLQDLEEANAFVVSLDANRSWFRYHQMFAGLLALELRRTAPGEVAGLHRAASAWFAGHGHTIEAIRHAQAADDWQLAARLLADHWPTLHLDGQDSVIHELLAGFPGERFLDDSRLAVLMAADELAQGSLETAERYLGLAERVSASEPVDQNQLLLGVVRLQAAHQRGDLPAVTEQAQRLEAVAAGGDPAEPGLGQVLRSLALIRLGGTEVWAGRHREAVRHLEQGVALARRVQRPFLEFSGLASQSAAESFQSLALAIDRGKQAIALAERHGWSDEPSAGTAALILGVALTYQGRLDEAEPWIQRAERTIRSATDPVTGLVVQHVRGLLELGRGRTREALAAFRAAGQPAGRLAGPHLLSSRRRALVPDALVRLGEIELAEQAIAEFTDDERDSGEIRITTAMLRLAQADPHGAIAVLPPVLDGSAPLTWPHWLIQAFLLAALARHALGDENAAEQALEHALDLAEPDRVLLPFLLHPVSNLLARHVPHRTAHAALIAEIQSLLAGRGPVPASAGPRPLLEPLSDSERRVLRYLATNLTAPAIADELSVSHNTVKTHMRNLYAKLGAHRRSEAVAQARTLGLLAPGR